MDGMERQRAARARLTEQAVAELAAARGSRGGAMQTQLIKAGAVRAYAAFETGREYWAFVVALLLVGVALGFLLGAALFEPHIGHAIRGLFR